MKFGLFCNRIDCKKWLEGYFKIKFREYVWRRNNHSQVCNHPYGGGYKVVGTLSMPKPKKAMFPEEMERNFIKSFNESQPNAVNKAVSVHILRN